MPLQEIVYVIDNSPALQTLNIFVHEDGSLFLTHTLVANPEFPEYKTTPINQEKFYKIRSTLNEHQKAICDFLRFINKLSPISEQTIKRIFTDLDIPIPKPDEFQIIFSIHPQLSSTANISSLSPHPS